jgi:hypothetical protein
MNERMAAKPPHIRVFTDVLAKVDMVISLLPNSNLSKTIPANGIQQSVQATGFLGPAL